MDLQQASNILEIEMIKIMDMKTVKKQYHKLALQNHPDKNGNTVESTQKFKRINEAYFYLKEINERIDHAIPANDDQNEKENMSFNIDYTYILNLFIKNIIQCKDKEAVFEIIKDIVVSCKQVSIKLFEGLDKYICIEIYEFISKYRVILHVSQETIDAVKQIILEKFKNDQVYILNPNINDLFENNIYKITVSNKTYLVPLWHNELYFDYGDSEIIVKCIPDLPDNVEIDENNNLLVLIDVKLTQQLLENPSLSFNLGTKHFNFQINNLNIQKSQQVMFKRQGISQINEYEMYNINSKSDVIAIINLSI
jgi:DnaJ-domain-containing protein 1